MKVEIRCPSCSKIGIIIVSEEAIKETSRGLLAVNIEKDFMCSHSFIAYIDKNMRVRDYFTTDFTIELPEMVPGQQVESKTVPEKDQIDLDLIKLNMPPTLLTHIIRGFLFKKRIIIISDQDYLFNYFQNFFKFITEKSYNIDINLITNEEYRNNKKSYKKDLVLFNLKVVNDPDKIINPKYLEVEKQFVQRFFAEYEAKASLIFLKNEILKSYKIASAVKEIIVNIPPNVILNSKYIIDKLEKEYLYDIKILYLNFLVEILRNYFQIDVPKLSDVSDFLSFL